MFKNTKVHNLVSEDINEEPISRSQMARQLKTILEANQVFGVRSEEVKQMGELFTEQYLEDGEYSELLRDFVAFTVAFNEHFLKHRKARKEARSSNEDLELANLKNSLRAVCSQAFRKKPG